MTSPRHNPVKDPWGTSPSDFLKDKLKKDTRLSLSQRMATGQKKPTVDTNLRASNSIPFILSNELGKIEDSSAIGESQNRKRQQSKPLSNGSEGNISIPVHSLPVSKAMKQKFKMGLFRLSEKAIAKTEIQKLQTQEWGNTRRLQSLSKNTIPQQKEIAATERNSDYFDMRTSMTPKRINTGEDFEFSGISPFDSETKNAYRGSGSNRGVPERNAQTSPSLDKKRQTEGNLPGPGVGPSLMSQFRNPSKKPIPQGQPLRSKLNTDSLPRSSQNVLPDQVEINPNSKMSTPRNGNVTDNLLNLREASGSKSNYRDEGKSTVGDLPIKMNSERIVLR